MNIWTMPVGISAQMIESVVKVFCCTNETFKTFCVNIRTSAISYVNCLM